MIILFSFVCSIKNGSQTDEDMITNEKQDQKSRKVKLSWAHTYNQSIESSLPPQSLPFPPQSLLMNLPKEELVKKEDSNSQSFQVSFKQKQLLITKLFNK